MDNSIAITIKLPVSIERAWNSIQDWESQSDWMLQTRVWVTSEIREGIGTEIEAFTGLIPSKKFFGILDSMRVTQWNPPYSCEVLHTGKIIKGTGLFRLEKISDKETFFHWSEIVIAPRALFLLTLPGLYLGVRISLSRFARALARTGGSGE
jgi:hypothetical protein